MSDFPASRDSHYYADHDDCTAHGGDQGHESEMRFPDGRTETVWMCPCGSWYYIPTIEQILDC